MAWTDYVNTVQKVYIAYYQRPGDPGGIRYWAQRLDAVGGNLNEIINAFATSPESQALYGTIDATTVGTFIDNLYQALFNRTPDEDGKNFYVDGFTKGQFTAGSIARDILNGAQNDDLVAIQNKLTVANRFTEVVDGRPMTNADFGTGTTFNVTYSGNTDAQNARQYLATVTSSPASIQTTSQVTAWIQSNIADSGDPIQQQPTGQTFTLTAGTDLADNNSSSKSGIDTTASFKFTNGNETVTAGAGTLGNTDVLLDASTSDNDVLNATLTALVGPTLQNIETINLTIAAANAGLNMNAVTGTKTVTLTGSANGTITNIDATSAPTIEVKNYTKVATLEFATLAGTKDALTVRVSGMTGSATVTPGITLDTAVAGALETLNLESAGTSKNTVELKLDATPPVVTAVNKTVVTGDADLDLRVAHGLINGQTLDASGHKGALNLIVDRNTAGAATTNLTNVSGYDTLTVRDSTAGGDSLVLTGVLTGSTVVLANAFANAAASIGVKGAASNTKDTLTVVIDHSTDATDIDVNGASPFTIADIETLTIKSEGGTSTGNKIQQLVVDAGSALVIDGSTKLDLGLQADSKVSTITLKGSGNHKVAFNAAAAYGEGKNLTIDGSEATGKLTIDMSNFKGTLGGATETVTILGSAQDDTITVTPSATTNGTKAVIDAGAGKDTVTVNTQYQPVTVTLGAGADELKIDDVNGTNFVTITDFALGAGGDKLSVNTAGAVTFGGVGAASAANQLIILNAAVADDAAAKTAADGTSAGERAIIVINNASGVAELWYDPNGNSTANDAVKLAVFENITTVGVLTDATNGFIAANFGTWA